MILKPRIQIQITRLRLNGTSNLEVGKIYTIHEVIRNEQDYAVVRIKEHIGLNIRLGGDFYKYRVVGRDLFLARQPKNRPGARL